MPVPLLPLSSTPKWINCNCLYCKLAKSQLSRLQHNQNSLACTVVKAPKSCHITPTLRSLHLLRITERIELPTKFSQLPNLQTFITLSPFNVLAVLTLHPSLLLLGHLISSSLKMTDRSFHYALPCLWSQLPLSLHQPYFGIISDSLIPSPITSSSSDSPLCSSVTPSLFHSRLKTYLFRKSYPP